MNKIERANERQRQRIEGEIMFEDYRQAVLAYAEWMDDFRKRTGLAHPFVSRQAEAA